MFLGHNNDRGDGMYNEMRVHMTDAIKTHNSYQDIAHSIAEHLAKKTKYNTLSTNWFVFVSDSANGIHYSPAGYAFIRIGFETLEITIFKTAY
jgi:hypothetical protein